MSYHLNVNEVFGTVQGEGRHAGQAAWFVRLSGCNLSCDWCDTPYTWNWQDYDHAAETNQTDPEGLAALLDTSAWRRVVVTGGEPLLQAQALSLFLRSLHTTRVDLETNGTRPLGPTRGMWDTVTCSPKVGPSSGQGQTSVDESIMAVADFKFVIADQLDLDVTRQWVAENGLHHSRVWLMPEGADRDTLLARTPMVAEAAVEEGFNFTSRLHVLAWGNERGR